MPPLSTPPASIPALRQRLQAAGAGPGAHETLAREVIGRARSEPAAAHVFTALYDEAPLAAARAADEAQRRGAQLHASRPLAGLPVSIKDLFDVAGEPTLAGSRVLQGRAAAAIADAPAVQRLRAAGAAIVGRTRT
ncbi:MAG: amidase family protein [Rubrivivax sp.]